jgi:hypothetical protein
VSRHLRAGFAAFFLVAGFSTGFSTPAASNAFTDLFTPKAAPEESTAAAAPAQDDCLPRPGEQAAAGQHWVYRYDGHRKCWFQAAEDSAAAKKAARHRPARHSVAAPESDKSVSRKPKEEVEDARAELVSPAPAEAPQPTLAAPQIKVVKVIKVTDADPGPATVAAALVPPAPVLAQPSADQPASDQSRPRHVDVETLLADAPAASDEVAYAHKAMPVAAPGAETDGGGGWTTTLLGVLLMALGLVALLSASPPLRQTLLAVRFWGPEPDSPSSQDALDQMARAPASSSPERKTEPRLTEFDGFGGRWQGRPNVFGFEEG